MEETIRETPDEGVMQTTAPPPASQRSAKELLRVSVAELERLEASNPLDAPNWGKGLLVRITSDPTWTRGNIWALAKDRNGVELFLEIGFQLEEVIMPASEVMWPGRIGLVKEPIYIPTKDDQPFIMSVWHISDLVWLDYEEDGIPEDWIAEKEFHSSEKLRQMGNEATEFREWAKAHRLYTSAIKTAKCTDDREMALLNRSWANLMLLRPEKALADARGVPDVGPRGEKQMFREARALYELGQYEDCLDKFKKLYATYSANKAAASEIERTEQRLREQLEGTYNFPSMQAQANEAAPFIDCATFSKRVKVGASSVQGDGLFTAEKVIAGQLLLCEKAMAYVWMGEAEDEFSSHDLVAEVIHLQHHSSNLTARLRQLARGTLADGPDVDASGDPIVDTNTTRKIIGGNANAVPQTSRSHRLKLLYDAGRISGDPMGNDFSGSHAALGLWPLRSRAIHSCLHNCAVSYIGDMLLLHATKNLDAGAELYCRHSSGDHWESNGETRKRLKELSYECQCALCEGKQSFPAQSIAQQRNLKKRFDKVWVERPLPLTKLDTLLGKLETSYKTKHRDPSVPQVELFSELIGYCGALSDHDQPAGCIKAGVRALEAMGFKVTAWKIGDLGKFEIHEWGTWDSQILMLLLDVLHSYKRLKPRLCDSVKHCIEKAYRMAVGESETLPGLFAVLT